jgi:hypothetical protein
MSYESRVIRVGDIDQPFAAAWDGLPPARGLEADFLDSHAWLGAWCQVAGAGTVAAVRIPVVLDGGRPVALLPLEARSRGRWESAGTRAFRTHRRRYRPVLGSEQPDRHVVGLLVDAVGRAGVRELALNRLPAHDPATGALLAALRRDGYVVHSWERSSDCLTTVDGAWDDHRRRFASYERSVKRLVRRCAPWTLGIEEYGPQVGRPVASGFALYEELHERSWKGSLAAGARQERLALLCRAEQLGWCRIYVLRVAGVPAAAEIWFRLGQVASVPSMVYNQQLASLGPGSILVWWAQERAFAESPPRIIDHLPGHNPLKDRIATHGRSLLIVEAVRRAMIPGASLPLRRRARSAGHAMAARMRAATQRARPRPRSQAEVATWLLEVEPGPVGLPAARLELDAPLRRFLTVTGSHRSPEGMTKSWQHGDTWWRVGTEPAALVRLGVGELTSAPVREVVLVQAGAARVEELIEALAAVVGMRLRAELPSPQGGRSASSGRPIPVLQAPLPWPTGQVPATKVP